MASLKRVLAALKRYRASVLKAACEGRLVPTEAELARRESRSYEPATTLLARILEERRDSFDRQQANAKTRKKYMAPAQPEEANLSSLPEGWVWETWRSAFQLGHIRLHAAHASRWRRDSDNHGKRRKQRAH